MTGTNARHWGCKLCGEILMEPMLDLAALPPCNRFLDKAGGCETHDLSMAACGVCGLVQLADHPDAAAVVPRVPWISYNEPEEHLDDAVGWIQPFVRNGGTALGVGPFDMPLLRRLADGGLHCRTIDPLADAPSPASGTYPYLETIQGRLRPSVLSAAASREGTADFVVCRFLLEHSHDPVQSLIGLKALLAPGGTLYIEVPGSENFLFRGDYSFIWEEHICYFTEHSLKHLAARAGFQVRLLRRVAGALDDLLVAVLIPAAASFSAGRVPDDIAATFAKYRDDFPAVRAAYRGAVDRIVASGGGLAVFGAGHQSILFAHALGLTEIISLFVDDDPRKAGSYIPGQRRPIQGSDAILEDPEISVCLLATPPRIEGKIRAKLAHFLERGGQLYSMFPRAELATLVGQSQ